MSRKNKVDRNKQNCSRPKMKTEATKKTLTEEVLEMGKLGKQTGIAHASITNRIYEVEEIISGIADTLEGVDSLAKENVESK